MYTCSAAFLVSVYLAPVIGTSHGNEPPGVSKVSDSIHCSRTDCLATAMEWFNGSLNFHLAFMSVYKDFHGRKDIDTALPFGVQHMCLAGFSSCGFDAWHLHLVEQLSCLHPSWDLPLPCLLTCPNPQLQGSDISFWCPQAYTHK